MLENVTINTQSSIRIADKKVIRFDPFKIDKYYNDADLIFITHSHYDHLSIEDLNKVRKDNTIFVIPESETSKLDPLNIPKDNIIKVVPNEEYQVLDYKFNTIPSYNTNKSFHKEEYNWVGYIIEIANKKYYIAGDTDITKENKIVKCDIAFLPIGGTYTMDYEEAAKLTNLIKPIIVIPIHYGSIVGQKEDANRFKEIVDNDIEVICLVKD